MLITDFDPREDVLQLPLQSSVLTTGQGLQASVKTNLQTNGLNSNEPTLVFTAGGVEYAYLQLSDDFLTDMGLTGNNTGITNILNNIFNLTGSTLQATNGTVGFTNLSQDLLSLLPQGGFAPVTAQLPSDSTVAMYGAIGGLVATTNNGILAGTNYSDVLSGNSTIVDPSLLNTTGFLLSATPTSIYGFGGADLIYGTAVADILNGGDGDDVIYSFTTDNLETVSSEDGDDLLIGGDSAGFFDGGTGSDTFSVFYLTGTNGAPKPLQLVVNLVEGWAAEQAEDGVNDNSAAPVGPAPFTQAEVPNTYTLTNIENAIGGPLNDWIQARSGSIIEGAEGGDFLLAEADGVTLSYEGSEQGVSVQIFEGSATSSGGDAEGDVIATTIKNTTGQVTLPFTATNFDALVGSVGNDTLGGFISVSQEDAQTYTFTGNGGTDVFQITGVENNGAGSALITDFDSGSGDKIDLRPLGTVATQLQFTGSDVIALGANGQSVVLAAGLGTLTQSDFLLSTPVSGSAEASAGGDGLSGSNGSDQIYGNRSQDYLFGNGGNDLLTGEAGDDMLDGGKRKDRLDGGSGDDLIHGGKGQDRLNGEQGADQLLGGTGRDRLNGGSGDDLIDGGVEADTMRGGKGADTFLLTYGEINGDLIEDYSRSEGDRLVFVGSSGLSIVDGAEPDTFVIRDGRTRETITVVGAKESDFLFA